MGLFGDFVEVFKKQKGGARPGAGRKPSRIKIEEEEQKKINEMLRQRKVLVAELHDPALLLAYKDALMQCIRSPKVSDRAWALRILTEVYLKIQIPKEITDKEKSTSDIIADLLSNFEDKLSDGLLADSEIGSSEFLADSSELPEGNLES